LKHIKRHIAFVLTGFLIFPIIFQSIPVVWHHSYDHSEIAIHSSCSNNDPGSCKDVSGISTSSGHCPICEYQFTVNILPDCSIQVATVPVITATCHDIATGNPHLQIVALKSPRAPPFLM
jgi:hypothetical protein